MNQRSIWMILLLALVILSGFLILFTNSDHASDLSNQEQSPDGYMTRVVATQMNKQGDPRSTLYSPIMVHYAIDNSTDMTKPHFVILANQGTPWDITALHGKTNFGIHQVILWDTVRIHREASPHNQPIDLKTENLTVYPNLQFATTDAPVTIQQLDSLVHAQGLRANLKTGVVKLQHQSEGFYNTKQPLK